MRNDASAGRLWLLSFALAAFGVLGLVVVAGHLVTGPARDVTCSAVLVEETTGSREVVLTVAERYLRAPGAGFPHAESARIGDASIHDAGAPKLLDGQKLPGTQLPTTTAAILQALEELAPGHDVAWSWDHQEADARYSVRVVLVARWDDERYQVEVEDVTCAPLEALAEPPAAPH